MKESMKQENFKGEHLKHVSEGTLHRWGIEDYGHKMELLQIFQNLGNNNEGNDDKTSQ